VTDGVVVDPLPSGQDLPRTPLPPLRKASRRLDRTDRRRAINLIVAVLCGLAVIAVLFPLADIIYTAFARGGGVLFQANFLSAEPPPPCSAISCSTVGIGPEIEGTLVMVGMAAGIAVPIGVLSAIFASEYRGRGLGRVISFTADVMTGIPSIIIGAVIYTYFVIYAPTIALSPHVIIPSAIAGSLALSIIMIPIIERTTEEALRLVPNSIREAALALGIPKWKSTLRIVVYTALPGAMTGILLAVMRAAGEAAPLLFTASGSNYYLMGLNNPTGALPLIIYYFALSPSSNWIRIAWGATLFLLITVLTANVLSRVMIHRLARKMGRV
jgi:phosphate transport system permease protein